MVGIPNIVGMIILWEKLTALPKFGGDFISIMDFIGIVGKTEGITVLTIGGHFRHKGGVDNKCGGQYSGHYVDIMTIISWENWGQYRIVVGMSYP